MGCALLCYSVGSPVSPVPTRMNESGVEVPETPGSSISSRCLNIADDEDDVERSVRPPLLGDNRTGLGGVYPEGRGGSPFFLFK